MHKHHKSNLITMATYNLYKPVTSNIITMATCSLHKPVGSNLITKAICSLHKPVRLNLITMTTCSLHKRVRSNPATKLYHHSMLPTYKSVRSNHHSISGQLVSYQLCDTIQTSAILHIERTDNLFLFFTFLRQPSHGLT